MITRIGIILAASSIVYSPVSAQYSHPIELGFDAGISIGLSDNSETIIRFPIQAVRLGFFLDQSKSIEPKFAVTTVTGSDGYTAYRADLGFLYHFYGKRRFDIFPDRTPRSAVFVRPFAGIQGVSSNNAPDTRADILGIGLGVKFALVDRVASRFEVNFSEFFTDNDVGANDEYSALGLLAGLSFFFR
jgi:hypothetical protein